MNYKIITIFAVLLCISLIFQYYQKKRKNILFDRLKSFLKQRDFDSFEKLYESKEVRNSFAPYNLYFLNLNEKILKGKKEEIDQAFDSFENLRMNKAQSEALSEKGFYYYLNRKNSQKCKYYYRLLKQSDRKDIYVFDWFYDTYILNGNKYLNDVLNKVNESSSEEKKLYYPLLAMLYRNAGEENKAKEYETKVNVE